ncbi:MAG: phage baseplate assembly protein V [Chloroflexota bacterium]
MSGQGPPFYGKYRGIVTDNRDPLMQGRIKASVSNVFGNEESGWALPSVPYAGDGVGLFLIPPVDAWVWIEFEQGEPDKPIWSGCFWSEGQQMPAGPAAPEMKVLKTGVGTITLNDTSGAGGIIIETTNGMKIKINSMGIEIDDGQNGSIKLTGPKVSINDGALEVT